MTEQEITIQVEGRHDFIAPESFVDVIASVVGTLKSVDSNMWKVGKPRYRWRIASVSMDSPMVMTLRAELGITDAPDADVVGASIRGWEELGKGIKDVPEYFTAEDLGRANKMACVYGDSVGMLKVIDSKGKSFDISPSITKTVESIRVIKPDIPRSQYGSIEGKLRQITVDDRENHLVSEFQIIDHNTGVFVKCRFDPDKAEEIGAQIKHRIIVFGDIKFDEAKQPKTIAVDKHRFLKDEDQLPSIEDIHKLKLRLPDDEDPADFIDKLRGVEDG